MERNALEIVVPDRPQRIDRDAILKGLAAFNDSKGGPSRAYELAVLLRDPRLAETVGGLWARSFHDWMYIELVFVPEEVRGMGLGSQLLQRAEQIASERGCVGIWVDTFSFQAPGFYQRHGYTVFGTLGDHPLGTQRFFLHKILKVTTG